MGGWLTSRSGRFAPGKETRYPLYRRLGGPQGRSGRVRKISPPPPPTEITSLDRLAHSSVAIPTELSRPTVHIVTTVFDSAAEKAQVVTLLISVLEFPYLNFGWQTGYTDCGLAGFLSPCRQIQGHLRLGHDHIFSNSLLTTINSFDPAYSDKLKSLIFMDPCIVVWISRNNQQDATLW
jgi:hypothetical protein